MNFAGFQAGPFRLDQLLGAGGMAEVWSVEGNPDVAVKLLSVRAAQVPRLANAVRTEVRVAAALHHPNIVRILDTGEVDVEGVSVPWIALERAEHSLAEASNVDVLEVLTQVLRALAHAHSRGVLHRDVKPGNILRLGDRWVLSDFGLARTERDEVELGGSPGYAAPEQVRGAMWEEGPWTDLYSVGAVAWALCTGQAPERPSDLSTGSVPEAMASWIAQASSYRANKRFFGATEALTALPSDMDAANRVPLATTSSESSTQYFLEDDPEPEPDTVQVPQAESRTIPLPADAPADAIPDSVAPSMRGLVPHPVPGQEAARQALWSGLRAAERGERSIVVLQGAPGSGRHALVSRVLAAADELGSASVVRVRASPTSPFRFHQLARAALGAVDGSSAEVERVASLWGIDDPALAELMDPGLPRIRLNRPSLMAETLGRALQARARQRVLVLAVEEATHALDVLWLVSEYPDALPERTLVVLTRTSEASAPAASLFDDLPAPVTFQPVSFGDGAQGPWQDALDAHLGLSAASERLAALPATERSVLEVAAILGRDVDEELWIRMCDATARPDPRDAVPRLLAEGWLEREGRERWLFRSDALRQHVLDTLSASDRHDLHTAAAEALSDRGPTRARAEHLLAMGDRLQAARVWYTAVGGPGRLWALALDELIERVHVDPPDTVWALAVAMRTHVASMAEAPEHEALFATLKDYADNTGDPIGQAFVDFARGWWAGTKRDPETIALIESRRLLNVPPDLDKYWTVCQFTLLQADLEGHLHRYDDALATAKIALTQATQQKHTVNVTLHIAAFELDVGNREGAKACLDEIAQYEHLMTGSMLSVARQLRGFIAEAEGDIEEAERQTRASIEIRDQMQLAAPFGRMNHAVYLTQLRRYDEARARMAEVEQPRGAEGYAFVVRLVLAAVDRDFDRVAELLEDAPEVLNTDVTTLIEDAAERVADRPDLEARIRAIPLVSAEAFNSSQGS